MSNTEWSPELTDAYDRWVAAFRAERALRIKHSSAGCELEDAAVALKAARAKEKEMVG